MIGKEGHADCLLKHQRTHHNWYFWKRCNCKKKKKYFVWSTHLITFHLIYLMTLIFISGVSTTWFTHYCGEFVWVKKIFLKIKYFLSNIFCILGTFFLSSYTSWLLMLHAFILINERDPTLTIIGFYCGLEGPEMNNAKRCKVYSSIYLRK